MANLLPASLPNAAAILAQLRNNSTRAKSSTSGGATVLPQAFRLPAKVEVVPNHLHH